MLHKSVVAVLLSCVFNCNVSQPFSSAPENVRIDSFKQTLALDDAWNPKVYSLVASS
jgi:hypothetical protein